MDMTIVKRTCVVDASMPLERALDVAEYWRDGIS